MASKILIFVMRVSLGWLMLYAGIVKVLNPQWSAFGYMKGAKTFSVFYNWLASPNILPVVDFINEWGLTLLGISLILGVFVRFSSILGALLMALYYLPVLSFPKVGMYSFLVDEHIIYVLVLLFFANIKAGRIWGLEKWCSDLPICSKFPKLRNLLG
ncbi:MAG: DoxX family protein [Candidatus Nealsonbacteria bacterium]|nr:DoxX family protein [Candidatus Nealsonbacteria bacterium]